MDKKKEKHYTCPIEITLSVIGGKWKPIILWHLSKDGIKRYGELKKSLNGITHKMLSTQLKELEADGLINRKEYQQVPPKVEYSLTERGKTIMPILSTMCEWAHTNMNHLLETDNLS